MTREEAVKIVKENMHLSYDNGNTFEALKTLVPELRESEDERIRKNLIELLLDTPAQDMISHNLELSKVLAYLEKQKEQTEELSIRLNGLMQEYVKSGKDEEEQEHRLKCYQLFWDALGDSEFFEQKEQKPEVECDIAQPVEQDGTAEPDYGICGDSVPGKLAAALRRHGWYLGHVGENQQMVEARKEEVMRNWPSDRYSLTQEQNLIMANSPKLAEQKPAKWEAWNEEDEYIMNCLIGDITDYSRVELIHQPITKYTKWLKSLGPRCNGKPGDEQ